MNVTNTFLKYVTIDTESDAHSTQTPSTSKQFDLANVLVEEMKSLGIEDAYVDTYGIVYGTIASNVDTPCDTIGFIAHMDTSPDMSGKNIKPRIIEQYDGNEIVLNEALDIRMDATMFDNLNDHVGQDLIVTDGTTLLGADDKAGIAEIMCMCAYVMEHDIPHGTIKIAFTPDEEVGRGTDHFDVEAFGADYAYTVDGSDIESIDYENFNAASALIDIQGSSIHPGDAKHKMVNASELAMEFHSLLPTKDHPALTQGYEGFNHLTYVQGECEAAKMEYIIRNHDTNLFAKQKEDFMLIADFLNKKYGSNTITLSIEDSYANMADLVRTKIEIVEKVEEAMKQLGMNPKNTPIRGGTDGARLTYAGLLCPNIGTGGFNFHGKYEFISIQSMEKIVKLLVKIVENNTI